MNGVKQSATEWSLHANITGCLLVGRINANRVTNAAIQYLNVKHDVHMEKLYMMTLQFFFPPPTKSFRVAAGLVLR